MNNNNNRVLEDTTTRTKGIDALNSNIEATKAVAQIIKTTLGPMGMDKMLIDNLGDTIITNDGVKILKEMEINHPGAQMLVEVAKTQESEVGDGTTTAVILSGEMLSNAQELFRKKIHPTLIIKGYKKASQKSLEILKENSMEINIENEKVIRDICETAMTGKVAEQAKETLSKIIYDITKYVKEKNYIPKDSIKIHKLTGGDTSDSFVLNGLAVDKKLINPNMPTIKKQGKILLIDFPLEVRELDTDAKISINTSQDYQIFLQQEHDYLKELAYKIKEIGVDLVICQKGIDDSVAYYLAKSNIMAIRRTRKSDMNKLSKALCKPIINSIDDLTKNNLGNAQNIEVKEILDEHYLFIEGLKNPKATTLFLKASTKYILDEIERATQDAIGDINVLLKSKRIVAGGGAIEIELYKELVKYSKTLEGKEQLIVEYFANSFLSIPKTLCENSGFDEIETIAKLISNHEKNKKKSGLDGFIGVVDDTIKNKIIEPIDVKSQAIKSATEITSMILRIDDIIAAEKLNKNGNI
ncbi:MAG: thermosome subunit alpha [Nanoarchaeota archaeon]